MAPAITGLPPTNENPRLQPGAAQNKVTLDTICYPAPSNVKVRVLPTKVLLFRKRRMKCAGCGIALVAGNICQTCRTWDIVLRAMSLRHQAIGDLMRVGG